MNKKSGFSLVEVMIIFVVMSAIIAAMMPSITMRSKSVPIKIARGAYICYIDSSGSLHEEVYNRQHKIRDSIVPAGQQCKFYPVKQAASYQITAIGAGAGGYDYAKLRNSDETETTKFTMGGGYSEYGTDMSNAPFPHKAVIQGEMIGYLSDSDLWENADKGYKLFKDEILRLSMAVPKGGNGGSVLAKLQSITDCTCSKDTGVDLSHIREVLYDYAVEPDYKWQNQSGVESQHASAEVRNSYSSLLPWNSTDSCGMYCQKKTYCEMSGPMGSGGSYNCGTSWNTVYGQAGGPSSSKKYWYDEMTMSDSSLTGYYALSGSKQYENVLKKFAQNMKVGKCTSKTDGSTCTFTDGSVSPGSDGTTQYHDKNNEPSIAVGSSWSATSGTSPNGRIAMKFPDTSNTSTGYKINFQTKKAGGGLGASAIIGLRCSGTGMLALYNQSGYSSSFNTSNDPEMDGGTFYSSDKGSYRPMLDIKTTLKHRKYENGKFGGNGQVVIATKTFFEGDCTLKIGIPGPAHKAYSDDRYSTYLGSDDGDTVMTCTDNFEVKARKGVPSTEFNKDDYVYTYEKRNNTDYKTQDYSRLNPKNPEDLYKKPVALELLTKYGHDADIPFGMGGDGTRFVDKCIAPKGTFIVNLKNEYNSGGSTQKLKQEYVLDEDKQCYADSQTYGTIMGGVSYSGERQENITSTYLDKYGAKSGTQGAIIITW